MHVLYRISKYDPNYRIDGVYTKNEWTDYSEIGLSCAGQELTFERYIKVEKQYIDTAVKISKKSGVDTFIINFLEKYEENCEYLNRQIIAIENLEHLLKQCLRNKCWCILSSKKCSISFGYDYYMYISTSLSKSAVIDICSNYNLFVDKIESGKTVSDMFGL